MTYIIQGLMIGFAYVAPIGVQNLFVINTALTQRKQRVYLAALIIMFFDVTLSIGCSFPAERIEYRSDRKKWDLWRCLNWKTVACRHHLINFLILQNLFLNRHHPAFNLKMLQAAQ